MTTYTYPVPRCRFHLRTPAYGLTRTPDHWKYTPLRLGSLPAGQEPYLHTPHVPRTGDLIHLHSDAGPVVCRVVGVSWDYPEYRSVSWPVTCAIPLDGPLVDVIVEESPGLFTDEAPDEEVR